MDLRMINTLAYVLLTQRTSYGTYVAPSGRDGSRLLKCVLGISFRTKVSQAKALRGMRIDD